MIQRRRVVLSILLCGTTRRLIEGRSFKIIKKLESQIGKRPVELIYIIDNKKRLVGTKRNNLLDMAQGKYVAFVDDDDDISDDYVKSLLGAVQVNADVIVFDVNISIEGGKYKKVVYGAGFKKDLNLANSFQRLPNHIMCVKRDIAKKVRFPDVQMGEDTAYAVKLKSFIKRQARISKVLYYYNFSHSISETQ
jgi:glycosyltransferase involved in cell wall biosynthesis